ncbi:hypothetical protein CEUSTIGMA_g12532.t1 [Chlamydomonas eustigma]|uniref:CUE domain-containing protein n=1 Tax=Chlamydomonas eustigma TaxID=1157962 RepID=A0A250XQ99_9CHLO|nr:hypothetical protein CEUSTIGMA_g12532.t1 [Chlamydomonas eustigma]|eukprot:GAX85112.1 hypothetical protein CEUSTIGMA_g12532.t1 [Chlamydomonas eustigma]
MSLRVAGHTRPKRLFEEAEANRDSPIKRLKQHSPCGGSHFISEAFRQVSPSALSTLLTLYPNMESQTVVSVLADCGDNIEAAIKRLGEMRLQEDVKLEQSMTSGKINATVASHGDDATPLTQEEWVEKLVQEMSAARDVNEARARAHRFLHSFGDFVNQDKATLQGRIQELQKESLILKRAVQIQNTKIQERTIQEAEVQQLHMSLLQCQEQVRTLEMSNYSLALHLQQATAGASVDRRYPDVF